MGFGRVMPMAAMMMIVRPRIAPTIAMPRLLLSRRGFLPLAARLALRASFMRRLSSSSTRFVSSSSARIVKKMIVARAYIFGVTVFFVML